MTAPPPTPNRLAPWGDLRVVAPLASGTRNAAYLAESPRGTVVVKTTRRSETALAWAAEAMARARRAGLSVPRMHRTTDGRLTVHGLIVEDCIDGTRATDTDMARLAPALTRFHRATAGMPPRPGLLPAPDLARTPGDADTAFAPLPRPLARTCRAALAALAGLPQSAVHGDVTPNNMIRGRDGRLWLIDWDECRRDATGFDHIGPMLARDPHVERARLAREVLIFWRTDPIYARRTGRRLIALQARANVF